MAVKASAQITLYRVIDIESTTRYYLLQSSTLSTPSKPTTNPPSNLWTKTEPSYTEGSTKTLYFTDLTVFTNNTFKYSEVSKSSSYEAAKTAYNKAVAADNRVQAAETKITQNKNEIDLRAAAIEESLGDAEGRLTLAESAINLNADGLESVVERTDKNETEISSLKQTASGFEAEITEAKKDASDASKVATNFLGFDSNGVVVGDRTKGTLGKNVMIDSDSVDIRDGSNVLASFAANQIDLGKNNQNAKITLCNNLATMEANNLDENYDSGLYIHGNVLGITARDYIRTNIIPTDAINYGSYAYYDDGDGTGIQVGYAGIQAMHKTHSAVIEAVAGNLIGDTILLSSERIQINAGKRMDLPACSVLSSNDDIIGHVQLRYSGGSPNRDVSFVGYEGSYEEGVAAKYFNAVMTNKGEMAAAGGFKVNGIVDKFTNNVLWSGGYYMTSGHTVTLSQAISNQPHGIVLVFAQWANGALNKTHFHSFFVAKSTVASYGGSGHSFNIFGTKFGHACTKYLYISNTKIVGHNDNNASGTGGCGIKYSNSMYVLCTVIGV